MAQRIRTAGETRGFSQTRLLTQWTEIAGPALAKIAQPVKIGYAKQGFGATLSLLVRGADAPMVQMQLPKLLERVNACYGYAAISRIRLVQTATTGFAEAPARFEPKPLKLSDQDRARIKTTVDGVADSDLQQALAALGENILKRSSSSKGKPS